MLKKEKEINKKIIKILLDTYGNIYMGSELFFNY